MDILISNQQKKRIDTRKIKRVAKKILENLSCPKDIEISILLIDNNYIRELNKKYLNKDKPTDVLSFPMQPARRKTAFSLTPSALNLLGDIVISVEKAEEQAKSINVSLDDEITRLLIHGILHILGHEHEKGGKKAREMKKEEERLLCAFA